MAPLTSPRPPVPRPPAAGSDGELHGDDFLYAVAWHVVEGGLTANAISRVIFPDASPTEKSRNIMRIKRALTQAVKRDILVLRERSNRDLAARLERCCPARFTVVEQDPEYSRRDSVSRAAARLLKDSIERIGAAKASAASDRPTVTVANSGGPTIARTLNFLQTIDEPKEQPEYHVESLSLNGARSIRRYGNCANVLAVRLAEIYGGSHATVLLGPRDLGFDERYGLRGPGEADSDRPSADADLFLIGAGSRDGFLGNWVEKNFGEPLPKEVIGDIALHPIDIRGDLVELPHDMARAVGDFLKPRPAFDDLVARAREGKVIVILSDKSPKPKLDVSTALLERGLASDCVLDVTLARKVCERLESSHRE